MPSAAAQIVKRLGWISQGAEDVRLPPLLVLQDRIVELRPVLQATLLGRAEASADMLVFYAQLKPFMSTAHLQPGLRVSAMLDC